MADWPIIPNKAISKGMPDFSVASAYDTELTSGGSTNTKGSWGVITDSAPYSGVFYLIISSTEAITYSFLFDIGIGAEGSEIVIAENIFFNSNASSGYLGYTFPVPFIVTAGTRVVARCQCSATSQTMLVSAMFCPSDFMWSGFSKVIAIGSNTANSRTTPIDTGSSANTKCAWVELSSSLAVGISGIVISVGGQGDATRGTAYFLIDIGVGPSSEVAIITDYPVSCNVSGDLVTPLYSSLIPIKIPAGTRIVARAASDNTTDTERDFDIGLSGCVG